MDKNLKDLCLQDANTREQSNETCDDYIHCRIVDHLTGLVQSCANVQSVSQACRFFTEHGLDFSDATGKDMNDLATFEIITQ